MGRHTARTGSIILLRTERRTTSVRETGTSHRRTGCWSGLGSGRQLALGYGTTIQNVEPGAGADMEANDTQGQLALGVWYTTEQDDERAGKWWSGDVLLRMGAGTWSLGRHA